MNELMNDEAIYRTAPATPGLLNCIQHIAPDMRIVANGEIKKTSSSRAGATNTTPKSLFEVVFSVKI